MKRAIADYRISGIETTLPFGTFVMNHDAFISWQFYTAFIDRYFTPDKLQGAAEELQPLAAISAVISQTKGHIIHRKSTNFN